MKKSIVSFTNPRTKCLTLIRKVCQQEAQGTCNLESQQPIQKKPHLTFHYIVRERNTRPVSVTYRGSKVIRSENLCEAKVT